MDVKLLLLRSGEMIISGLKQDNENQQYILSNPKKISYSVPMLLNESEEKNEKMVDISFSPWILLCKDEKIRIPFDWVVSLMEPIDNVMDVYLRGLDGIQD
jgi:hypothetical protein